MEEYFFNCPYCFTGVSILVDLSIPEQEYIEDCERCCNPIEFKIKSEDREIVYFSVLSIGQ